MLYYYADPSNEVHGPSSLPDLLALQSAGKISPSTLICPEGQEAWVEFQCLLPHIPTPPPPTRPPSFPRQSQPRATTPQRSPVRTHPLATPYPSPRMPRVASPKFAPTNDPSRAIRLSTLVAALLCFFLPWVELHCANQRLVYQNGFQTIIGTATAPEMPTPPNRAPHPFKNKDAETTLGYAWLVSIALISLIAALAFTINHHGRSISSIFVALALACLGLQAALGFPMQVNLKKDQQEKANAKKQATTKNQPPDPFDNIDPAKIVVVKLSPWFYAELALLTTVVGLGFFGPGINEIKVRPLIR